MQTTKKVRPKKCITIILLFFCLCIWQIYSWHSIYFQNIQLKGAAHFNPPTSDLSLQTLTPDEIAAQEAEQEKEALRSIEISKELKIEREDEAKRYEERLIASGIETIELEVGEVEKSKEVEVSDLVEDDDVKQEVVNEAKERKENLEEDNEADRDGVGDEIVKQGIANEQEEAESKVVDNDDKQEVVNKAKNRKENLGKISEVNIEEIDDEIEKQGPADEVHEKEVGDEDGEQKEADEDEKSGVVNEAEIDEVSDANEADKFEKMEVVDKIQKLIDKAINPEIVDEETEEVYEAEYQERIIEAEYPDLINEAGKPDADNEEKVINAKNVARVGTLGKEVAKAEIIEEEEKNVSNEYVFEDIEAKDVLREEKPMMENIKGSKSNVDAALKQEIKKIQAEYKVNGEKQEPMKKIKRSKDYKTLLDMKRFSFKILPEFVCNNTNPFVLIMVHTAPKNIKKRKVIRETWGQHRPHIHLLFAIGSVEDTRLQSDLEDENAKHGDFIQGNFLDTYRNLSYKHVMLFKYAVYHCPNAKFVLKTDDDVFINTISLVNILKNDVTFQRPNILFCRVLRDPDVYREEDSKWFVSYQEFANDTYPDYCPGWSLLYSRDLVVKLYEEAQRMEYFFWIDDVFVTGMIFKKLGIKHVEYESMILDDDVQYDILDGGFNKTLDPFLFGSVELDKSNIRILWNYVSKHVKTILK